jgi:Tol biopolymer transport system component
VTSITVVDWTPDGNELLVRVARHDKSTELAVVPATGGASRRVMAPAPFFAGVDEGRLSPDGRHLLYRAQAQEAAGTWNTRVRAVDGSSDELLVEHPTNAWNIGWTTDGRFAFYSAEPHSEGIWAVKVAAGKAQGPPERVSGKLDESIRPVGLTRGGALFYHTRTLDLQVRLMTLVPASRTLKPSTVLNDATAPGWSPDGGALAYAEATSGLIAIRTVATGTTRTIWTGLPGAIMVLQWLPDGGALAAQGVGPDGSMASTGLRRIDLTSGSRSDILLGPAWRQFGANPTFSGDAKTLTYKSFDGTQASLLTRENLETGQRNVLLERKAPRYVSSFAVLPRTGQIAVAVQEADNSSSIGVVEPSSEDLREIHRTPKGELVPANISLAWMPDGQSLLFVTSPRATNGSPMSLFRIPASGGKPEKLFEAELIFQVRVSPDGAQVALDTRNYRWETFVVDNLFATTKK